MADKQPWQMTRDADFATMYSTLQYGGDTTRVGLPKITKADVDAWITASVKGKNVTPEEAIGEFWLDPAEADAWHKMVVKQALREGKPVPAVVLKDYPDLLREQPRRVEPKPRVKIRTSKPRTRKSKPSTLKGVRGLSGVRSVW